MIVDWECVTLDGGLMFGKAKLDQDLLVFVQNAAGFESWPEKSWLGETLPVLGRVLKKIWIKTFVKYNLGLLNILIPQPMTC